MTRATRPRPDRDRRPRALSRPLVKHGERVPATTAKGANAMKKPRSTSGQPTSSVRRPHRVRGLVAVSAAAATIFGAGPAAASVSTHSPGAPSTLGLIVWTDRTDAGDHLMIARADGTHRRSLTPVTPDEGDIDAQVSPDGRWVMFEHDNPQTSTLRLVHPDGTGAHDIPLPCTGRASGSPGARPG